MKIKILISGKRTKQNKNIKLNNLVERKNVSCVKKKNVSSSVYTEVFCYGSLFWEICTYCTRCILYTATRGAIV